jgi:acetyl-CoA acyltransferase
MIMQTVYLVSALRTAIGKAPRGVFSRVRPDDLLAHVLSGVLARCPQIQPAQVDDVIVGCAMPEAEQGLNIARMALLLAGMPVSVPGMTINRFCASGLQAIAQAADSIRLGQADVMLAAGVESMSRLPMGGHRPAFNPRIFAQQEALALAYGMGMTAEVVAQRWKISREDQDMFALRSHQKAAQALNDGLFSPEILPYHVTEALPSPDGLAVYQRTRDIYSDEGVRMDCQLSQLAQLKPSFARNGSVTAGNSSQMSDGAAAVLLVSERLVNQLDLEPLARFVGYGVVGVEPEVMGIAPILAIPKVLKQAGLKLSEIENIELNEAFAAQSLAVMRELELDPVRVNPQGGAIALGHPLGATGTVRTTTLVHSLHRQQQRYGMVSMCIGSGMGAAGIFENVRMS